MDAAARDELDLLRRRAYGPSPDIGSDPEALRRLAELEELALPAVPVASEPSPPARGAEVGRHRGAVELAAVAVDRAPLPTALPAPAAPRRSPSRRRWQFASVAVVAVTAVGLALAGAVQSQPEVAGSAPTPTRSSSSAVSAVLAADPAAKVLIRLMIDASGDYVDLSGEEDLPVFPVSGAMSWVQPLGEYYGWALWIGGAPSELGDQTCLLVTAAPATQSACVSSEVKARSELLVSVPYEQIPVDERPPSMTADQGLTFVWGTGGFVTVLIGGDGD